MHVSVYMYICKCVCMCVCMFECINVYMYKTKLQPVMF